MSYITRQDSNDDQITLCVEHDGDGIKFTILSRLNPADSKSITLSLDQAAHLALDVADAAIPDKVDASAGPQPPRSASQ